jgi:FG-GAP repeat
MHIHRPPALPEVDESATVGDFNGDGRLDLATANITGSVSILINITASEVAEVIAFEDLEAGARLTEVFGSRGSGPIGVQGINLLLSKNINAAVVFDSACPPGGRPRDCTGEDIDLGTPNEAFGGPGVGRGGATNNETALGKVLIIAENVDDANRDERVDDPDDARQGGTLQLDFSALGTVLMHTITFVDLDDPDPAQQMKLFRGGITGTLLATVPLPVAGDNGVSVVPLRVAGVDTVVITLTDSAAIDNITFYPAPAG